MAVGAQGFVAVASYYTPLTPFTPPAPVPHSGPSTEPLELATVTISITVTVEGVAAEGVAPKVGTGEVVQAVAETVRSIVAAVEAAVEAAGVAVGVAAAGVAAGVAAGMLN